MDESQASNGIDARRKGKLPIAHVPLSDDEHNFPTSGKYSYAGFWWNCHIKGVSIERVFDEKLLNYIKFKYIKMFKKWGWWDFLVNPNYKARVEMVKVFYWNGKTDDDDEDSSESGQSEDSFTTNVCGQNIRVTINEVREAMGGNVVKGSGFTAPKNYDKTRDSLFVKEFCGDFLYMKVTKAIVLMMINQALLVRNDRFHEISEEDMWWIAKIMRRDPPDLCAAIFHKMRNSLKNAHINPLEATCMDEVCLPYGKLVTRIVEKKLNYNVNRREPFSTWLCKEEKPFDLEAFSKMFPHIEFSYPPPSSP